ncbi:MAG: hypothetical protein HXS46_07245 [Theionarchaea archaeon]|nr:hypothetical protein [Theionarchaea archaeon]
MKIGAIEKLQHLNAVVAFLFCILYPLLQYGGGVTYGLFVWIGSLPLLYFANLITYRGMSEEDTRIGKKAGILGNWCFIFFLLGMLWDNDTLMFAAFIPFIILIVAAIYMSKSRKRTL